jgi:putative acetyltransferase
MAKIIYKNEAYLKSFQQALDAVAKEGIYIEMTEAPDWERILGFYNLQVKGDWPAYYAIEDDKVVGWADISPSSNPRMSHRGALGMGVLSEYRGKGLGTLLLQACLEHASKIGLEKVELSVYSTNVVAIGLYKKFGFQQSGLIKSYRKLNGRYFDCVQMELFLR